jgi:hypothetical protein
MPFMVAHLHRVVVEMVFHQQFREHLHIMVEVEVGVDWLRRITWVRGVRVVVEGVALPKQPVKTVKGVVVVVLILVVMV